LGSPTLDGLRRAGQTPLAAWLGKRKAQTMREAQAAVIPT
jgi:hypothetical protein